MSNATMEAEPVTAGPNEVPVIYAALTERTVLELSCGLHDQKCRSGEQCPSRESHAIDCFGEQARNTLTVLAGIQNTKQL